MCTGVQFTFLLDDVGIPKDYRHMDGFGVHTFELINKAGKETLVKFHWKTSQGTRLALYFPPLPHLLQTTAPARALVPEVEQSAQLSVSACGRA